MDIFKRFYSDYKKYSDNEKIINLQKIVSNKI